MLTCSDVKATSLGTDDIPFSLTSGNILKRASSMAYILEIAPPRGQTGLLDLELVSQCQPTSHGSDAGALTKHNSMKHPCIFKTNRQQQKLLLALLTAYRQCVKKSHGILTPPPPKKKQITAHCLSHSQSINSHMIFVVCQKCMGEIKDFGDGVGA